MGKLGPHPIVCSCRSSRVKQKNSTQSYTLKNNGSLAAWGGRRPQTWTDATLLTVPTNQHSTARVLRRPPQQRAGRKPGRFGRRRPRPQTSREARLQAVGLCNRKARELFAGQYGGPGRPAERARNRRVLRVYHAPGTAPVGVRCRSNTGPSPITPGSSPHHKTIERRASFFVYQGLGFVNRVR